MCSGIEYAHLVNAYLWFGISAILALICVPASSIWKHAILACVSRWYVAMGHVSAAFRQVPGIWSILIQTCWWSWRCMCQFGMYLGSCRALCTLLRGCDSCICQTHVSVSWYTCLPTCIQSSYYMCQWTCICQCLLTDTHVFFGTHILLADIGRYTCLFDMCAC